jgi:hypothetical protein
MKKIILVERRKLVERDPIYCGNSFLQDPQQRRSLSLVRGELRETNPCVSLWFASLSCFLAYLIYFHFDLLGCATCVCRSHYLLVIIRQGHSLSLVCARSQEEHEAVFAGSLWSTGLTGAGQRSDWCLLWEAEPATDQTDQHHRSNRWRLTVQVFREEKFKLVVPLIQPPPGDINVLSIKCMYSAWHRHFSRGKSGGRLKKENKEQRRVHDANI